MFCLEINRRRYVESSLNFPQKSRVDFAKQKAPLSESFDLCCIGGRMWASAPTMSAKACYATQELRTEASLVAVKTADSVRLHHAAGRAGCLFCVITTAISQNCGRGFDCASAHALPHFKRSEEVSGRHRAYVLHRVRAPDATSCRPCRRLLALELHFLLGCRSRGIRW